MSASLQKHQQSRSPVGPVAILSPCSHSHPFDERRIQVSKSEENAVKIGRSVVRLQPTPNNAIFDCKVLSRNHAIMWASDEGHRFFIKDTKSSNGTFINNERLSASGEESGPRELFTGDILQLGVEIVDNTKKVASGCVTCIVRLINDNGEECPGRSSTGGSEHGIRNANDGQIPLTKYTLIRNDKLFMMDQYVKEAKFRENLLGQKLQQLEEQLEAAQEALESSWKTLINEEQLLSRIELLESQLAVFATKQHPGNDEKLRNEIQGIHEDRAKAESIAKDSLRQAEEQVFETSMKLHDAENGLMNQEEECGFLRQKCQEFEQELQRQRDEYDQLLGRYNDTLVQLNASERAVVQLSQSNGQERALNNSEINYSPNKDGGDGLTTSPGGTEFRISPVADNFWQTKYRNKESGSGLPSNDSFNFIEQQLLETLSTVMQNPSGGREGLIRKIKQIVRVGADEDDERQWIEVPAEPLVDNAGRKMGSYDGWNPNERSGEDLCQLCSPDSPRHLTRSSDFQVCLLSTLPFILLIYLVLLPLYYLRVPRSWTWENILVRNKRNTTESESERYSDEAQPKN